MIWANFLHFYQPPTQKPYWIKRITDEAYRPLVRGLKSRPHAKLSLNVNGVLLEQFERFDARDVIDDLGALLRRGQIELTGSAKYHPLLPFLPKEEAVRQIKLQEETLKKFFGDAWTRRGFFPPEMGFDMNVARTISELGYEWIVVDELSHPGAMKKTAPIDYSKIYAVEGLENLKIFFRERWTSWVILSGQVGTGALLLAGLGDRLKRNEYLLTAMDGETFGHHRAGLEQLLFEIYDSKILKNVLISDLSELFNGRGAVNPGPSTWALMEKDLERKRPFARWRDEENPIHAMQWQLTELAIQTVAGARKDARGYGEARKKLDEALHSDQYWWASARPWWSIEMIERGAKELHDAVHSAPGVSSKATQGADELYKSILFTAFDWQREGVVEALASTEDEEIRERTDAGLPRLPKKEIDKMVANLRKEISLLVKKEEYERAAQIRDRIRELKKYAADGKEAHFSAEGSRAWNP
ncbi:MAG: UvrB/UvrC motif-containing protein [Candidatus Liptonbacteria bacterium]|nr:UvrB/UvrC motif-containing protein [Candidatus Liptonbacteria bacterium]